MGNIKNTNKLLKQLLPAGVLSLLVGGFLAYGIITSDDYPGIGNLLAILLGGVLGFGGAFFIEKGGALTFYFREHKQTKEEKDIDVLISQYRSNISMVLVILIFTIAVIFKFDYVFQFSLGSMLGLAFLSLISLLLLCNGIKFISSAIKYKLDLKNNL